MEYGKSILQIKEEQHFFIKKKENLKKNKKILKITWKFGGSLVEISTKLPPPHETSTKLPPLKNNKELLLKVETSTKLLP